MAVFAERERSRAHILTRQRIINWLCACITLSLFSFHLVSFGTSLSSMPDSNNAHTYSVSRSSSKSSSTMKIQVREINTFAFHSWLHMVFNYGCFFVCVALAVVPFIRCLYLSLAELKFFHYSCLSSNGFCVYPYIMQPMYLCDSVTIFRLLFHCLSSSREKQLKIVARCTFHHWYVIWFLFFNFPTFSLFTRCCCYCHLDRLLQVTPKRGQ